MVFVLLTRAPWQEEQLFAYKTFPSKIGAIRSKLLELIPTFPIASVCEAVIILAPAPAEKVTLAWNVAAVQGTLAEAATPVPEIATFRPVSQLPPIVSPMSF
ncbi:hypothetical protein D3C87_1365150 [compost metagenome]